MQTITSLSWFNKIGLVVLAVGIPYLVIQGQWIGAAVWAVALVYLAIAAIRSVQGRAEDAERVSAAQPFDERDDSAIRSGFAAVGQVAFLGQIAIVIWLMGQPDGPLLLEAAKLVVLAAVLGIANRSALKRS